MDASPKITVTELARACADPTWRARWIRGQNPAARRPPAPGEALCHGGHFHNIIASFQAWLMGDGDLEAAALTNGGALWHVLHEKFAKEHLNQLLTRFDHGDALTSVDFLAQALKAYCEELSTLQRTTPDFRHWRDVLIRSEGTPLEPVPFHFPQGSTLVSGRWDAVRRHPERGLEVVDYKLSRNWRMHVDLLQLAIYAALLRRVRPNAKGYGGVLEYYNPQCTPVAVEAITLQRLFQDKVRPVLSTLIKHAHKRTPG